jgi:hypothetical protein
MKITWKLAKELMDLICCLIYCGTGTINKEEAREVFLELCDRYGIEEVEEPTWKDKFFGRV